MGYTQTAPHPLVQRHIELAFYHFEERDYLSWTGVDLFIEKQGRQINVETRSRHGRSRYDYDFQEKTCRLVKEHFGGKVKSDGAGWVPPPEALLPPASGCRLAYQSFHERLNLLDAFMVNRGQPLLAKDQHALEAMYPGIRALNPNVFLGNLLVPFLVSAMELFFKRAFIALLSYSPRKDTVLRSAQLRGHQLAAIARGELTVERAFAENLSFQSLKAVQANFRDLDPKLDPIGPLRSIQTAAGVSLFDAMQAFVEDRHDIIHRASHNLALDGASVMAFASQLRVGMRRVFDQIVAFHQWPVVSMPFGVEPASFAEGGSTQG